MTIDELIQQKAVIEKQLFELRTGQRADAISQALELIRAHDLTERDLFKGSKTAAKLPAALAPKYRNPSTGETWSGRGRPPKWLNVGDRSTFVI